MTGSCFYMPLYFYKEEKLIIFELGVFIGLGKTEYYDYEIKMMQAVSALYATK